MEDNEAEGINEPIHRMDHSLRSIARSTNIRTRTRQHDAPGPDMPRGPTNAYRVPRSAEVVRGRGTSAGTGGYDWMQPLYRARNSIYTKAPRDHVLPSPQSR